MMLLRTSKNFVYLNGGIALLHNQMTILLTVILVQKFAPSSTLATSAKLSSLSLTISVRHSEQLFLLLNLPSSILHLLR